MSTLSLTRTCVIRRPLDVVRRQFLDFDHHIAVRVHRRLDLTVLSRADGKQRVRQKFRVYGMPKVDEFDAYLDPSGAVVQEFLKGDFAGGRIVVRFTPRGDTETHVEAKLDAPLRGLNRLMAPLIRRVVNKLADEALEEDRRDLEQGGYR